METSVFQTEPVNINEESEAIDQNTQIRNQGIIALSYRDWEVKHGAPGSSAPSLGRRPGAHMFSVLCQEIVKTFEISEPVIVSSQSQQRLDADAH